MAEAILGNLYDMNKSILKQVGKELKGKSFYNKIDNVLIPYIENKLQNSSYFMLLCHEKRDYTIFNFCNGQYFFKDKIDDFKEAFIETLTTRGEVFGLEKAEDNVALEIWLRIDEEIYCYYLFPCDACIEEV